MARKSNYTLMQERIDANRLLRERVFTEVLGGFLWKDGSNHGRFGLYDDTPTTYPLTDILYKSGTIMVHTRKALRNLAGKGNKSAEEIVTAATKGVDKVINLDDLSFIMVDELMSLEKQGLLAIEPRENGTYDIVSTNERLTGPIKPALYKLVTDYMYSMKTKNDRYNRSYEVETEKGELKLVNVMNRKELAKYVDIEAIKASEDWSRLMVSIKRDTRQDALAERLSVLDGLLKGLTYAQIGDEFRLKISTIGAHVTAIRRIYKETFAEHKPNTHGMRYYRAIVARLCIHREFLDKVSVGSPIHQHFPQLEFDGVYFNFDEKAHELRRGGVRDRVSHDMLSNDGLLEKVSAHEHSAEAETSRVSKIKPSKKKFESAEFLYKCRHTHCLNPRNAALTEETRIREALELELKRVPEVGELKFVESKGKIQVFYGETLKSEYPIVKMA